MKDACKHTIRIAKEANDELQDLLRPYFLQRTKFGVLKDELSKKEDVVVWTHLSKRQRSMYETYLGKNDQIQSLLHGEKASPLEEINWLKKLCGHPLLCEGLNSLDEQSDEQLLEDSSKLRLLVDLVRELTKYGHRCLIFSMSTQVLDIISRVLNFVRTGRIDGKTSPKDRQNLIDKFNKSSKIKVLLLSTKAAGVGKINYLSYFQVFTILIRFYFKA